MPINIKKLLDEKVKTYNNKMFIEADPISIPHLFTKKQDIEIAGFFAAILAWGNRKSIINSVKKIIAIMDNAPYDFILHHQPKDLKNVIGFAHRTFNSIDLIYFFEFLKFHYQKNNSLESAFLFNQTNGINIEMALIEFKKYFFSLSDSPHRTTKHIASPKTNSACKKLNMYLRWMVRNDTNGVDFGIWKTIKPQHLICPLDVHVCNVAYKLGLIENNKSNWKNAVALTNQLKKFNPLDPVIYDYALFSLGVIENF